MSTFLRGMLFTCGGLTVLGILVIGGIALVAGGMSGSGDGSLEPEQENIVVRITGDEGVPFSGSYGELDGGQSVDGVTPQEYEVEVDTGAASLDSVTAFMQKSEVGGTLTVQIVQDGDVVAERSTSAEYGTVDVSWTPGS